MIRDLDAIEWHAMNAPTALMINYQGDLNVNTFKRAVESVSTRYSLLRTAVEVRSERYTFVDNPKGIMPYTIHQLDGEDHARNTGKAWDIKHALAQVLLIQGRSQGTVAMYTDHSIADGAAKMQMFRNLWKTYARIQQGVDETIINPISSISPSQALRNSSSPDSLTPPSPSAINHPPIRHVQHRHYIRLSERETYDLIGIARKCNMTVNSLLCGVILTTQRNTIYTHSRPVLMTSNIPVNLREHVHPRLEPTDTTNFSGLHRSTVQVDLKDDPIRVGVEVGKKLWAGMSSGDPLRNLTERSAGKLIEPSDPGLHAATVTNLGRVKPFMTTSGLTLSDFDMLTYSSGISNIGYAVYTYSDRLGIQLVYSPDTHPVSQVAKLATQLRVNLRNISINSPTNTV